MNTAGGRPAMLQRFPDGAAGKSFYQKRIPNGAPDWLESTIVSTPNGTTSNALVVADVAHVVWAVNIGCLGLHLWPYRAADPEHADELRIDLDPTTGIGFEEVRAAALRCRDLLVELGLRGYPKTTGSNGLHVYVRLEPRWDSIEVRAAAVALARELERRLPDEITANWWKEERGQPRLRRLQPERAAQDRVRRLVRPAPCRRAGVDPALVGGGRDGSGRRPHDPHRARPRAPTRGDPWTDIAGAPQSLDPLLAMAAADREAGSARCALAAAVPQDARRADPVAPSRAKKDG